MSNTRKEVYDYSEKIVYEHVSAFVAGKIEPRAKGWKNLRAGTPSWAVRPILRGSGVHGRVAEHLHEESARRS